MDMGGGRGLLCCVYLGYVAFRMAYSLLTLYGIHVATTSRVNNTIGKTKVSRTTGHGSRAVTGANRIGASPYAAKVTNGKDEASAKASTAKAIKEGTAGSATAKKGRQSSIWAGVTITNEVACGPEGKVPNRGINYTPWANRPYDEKELALEEQQYAIDKKGRQDKGRDGEGIRG